MCTSLGLQTENQPIASMSCDICCSEPGFCGYCCCILCCKTISSKHGGYNYIKCEAISSEGHICGHVAHMNCALRTYMAGTVGGSIGLNAEYYCRRCDARTDLVPHVTRLLRTCETVDSQDEIEKILNLGFCILRGSQRADAKGLLKRIEAAITKVKLVLSKQENSWLLCFLENLTLSLLGVAITISSMTVWYWHQLKCGTILEDIWKVEGEVSILPGNVFFFKLFHSNYFSF